MPRLFLLAMTLVGCVTAGPTREPGENVEIFESSARIVAKGACAVQGNTMGFQIDCRKDIATFQYLGKAVPIKAQIRIKDGSDVTLIRLANSREIDGSSTRNTLNITVFFADSTKADIALDNSGLPVLSGTNAIPQFQDTIEGVKKAFTLKEGFYVKELSDYTIRISQEHVENPSQKGMVIVESKTPFVVDLRGMFSKDASEDANLSFFPHVTGRKGSFYVFAVESVPFGDIPELTYFFTLSKENGEKIKLAYFIAGKKSDKSLVWHQ